MNRIHLRLIPLVAYVVLIFVVSSVPSLTPPGPPTIYSDKIAHFIEYAILGTLLARGIGWEVSRSRWATFGFLLAVGASIGALDEMYQSYIPGRKMDILDWCADSTGIALSVAIFAITGLGRRRPPPRGSRKANEEDARGSLKSLKSNEEDD